MQTRGSVTNLVNRYRAVLRRCRLIDVFGSLAVAAALVTGGAVGAGAAVYPNYYGTSGNGWAAGTTPPSTTVLSGFDGTWTATSGNDQGLAGTLYGGYAAGGDAVTGNRVAVEGGDAGASVYGGYSDSGAATGNKVGIKGGTVHAFVYGGYSKSGAATGNEVAVEGGEMTSVYGGRAAGGGNATENEVVVSGGTMTAVWGGWSGPGVATGNAVVVDGGTVRSSVYGGQSMGNAATGNAVAVEGGTVDAANGDGGISIYGGHSKSNDTGPDAKAVTGNKVAVSGGTFKEDVGTGKAILIYGGYASSGDTKVGGTEDGRGNVVTVSGTATGTLSGIYGGYAEGGGDVAGNGVWLACSTEGADALRVKGDVYGGRSGSGAVTGNTVVLSGGRVSGDVYGGYVDDGASVKGNTVAVTATAERKPDLTAVALHGGNKTVTAAVTGTDANVLDLAGMDADLAARSLDGFNVVRMGQGTLTVTEDSDLRYAAVDATAITSVAGDRKDLIVADGCTLSINTDTVVTVSPDLATFMIDAGTGGVYVRTFAGEVTSTGIGIVAEDGTDYAGVHYAADGKGHSKDDPTGGTATGGTLTIAADVTRTGRTYYGAYAAGDADATGGTLRVTTGGVVGGVTGGYAEGAGTAAGNMVALSGGRVSGDVTGGRSASGDAAGNAVVVDGPVAFGPDSGLHGGVAGRGTSTGNTLELRTHGVTVKGADGFQDYVFVVPGDCLNTGKAMLTVTGDPLVLTAGDRFFVTVRNDVRVFARDEVVLVVGAGQDGTDPAALVDSPVGGKSIKGGSAFVDLEFDLGMEGASLVARAGSATANADATAVTEAQVAAAAMLGGGADLASGQGLRNAVRAAADALGRDHAGAAVFGAAQGGKARLRSGSRVDLGTFGLMVGAARELSAGSRALTLGAFVETGLGSYDTRDGGTRGDGGSRYYGGGLMARLAAGRGGYAEATLRLGGYDGDWDSGDFGGRDVSYDVRGMYCGATVGIGHEGTFAGEWAYDAHARLLWTRQTGDDASVDGARFDFDDVDSVRTRLGVRVGYEGWSRAVSYVGLAWEHEFDGKARSTVNGVSVDAPSVRGDTGLMEIGVEFRPGAESAWRLDLGVTGSVGVRRGIGGQLQAVYRF